MPPEVPDEPAAITRAHRLAHEMNNLLDGSMKSIELALYRLRSSDLSADQARALERLESADAILGRMAGVVADWSASAAASRDLLDGAADARFGFTTGGGTVDDAFRHALSSVPASLERRGVRLSARADAGLSRLEAGALYNVISNAVKNAAESIERRWALAGTPDGDDSGDALTLELRRASRGGWLILTVTDTGAGLDPAVVDGSGRLRRGVTSKGGGELGPASNLTSERAGRTRRRGIGLDVCRRVSERFGGELTLLERDPRGVSFRFAFPQAALESEPDTEPDTQSDTESGAAA